MRRNRENYFDSMESTGFGKLTRQIRGIASRELGVNRTNQVYTYAQVTPVPGVLNSMTELQSRHAVTMQQYDKSSTEILGRWGLLHIPNVRQRETTVDTVINADVLPLYHPSGRPPLLVSVSANTGLYEQVFTQRLADRGIRYRVIAGDMSDIRRVSSDAVPFRFDASFMPFASGSVAAIFDRLGAIWHEAAADLNALFLPSYSLYGRNSRAKYRTTNHTLNMFQHHRDMLQVGGVIIVDEEIGKATASEISTGSLLDLVLGKNFPVPGFTMSMIGKKDTKMRVYKKA